MILLLFFRYGGLELDHRPALACHSDTRMAQRYFGISVVNNIWAYGSPVSLCLANGWTAATW